MPRVRAFAVLLFLLLAGCLQFDAQEMTLRYDAQKDQLSVLLVYRGLFCNGRVDEDMKQLRRCLETGEFAIWSNWPLLVNLASSNLAAPRKAFADLVDVENGGIFTTPTGELCAYQMLRVRSVKQFLAQLNQLLAVAVQLQSKQQLGADRHRFDEDTLEQLQDFVRGKEPFVRLDGSAVVLNVPCSDADHFWLLNESQRLLSYELGGALARKLAREPSAPAAAGEASETSGTQVTGRVDSGVPVVNGTGPGRPDGEQFATTADRICHELERLCEARLPFENPWSMQRLDGRTVLTLGFAHRPDNVLRKGPSGTFLPNLQPALDAEAIAYEKGVPDQELLRRFGEFCGRECKLPAALAARRSGK